MPMKTGPILAKDVVHTIRRNEIILNSPGKSVNALKHGMRVAGTVCAQLPSRAPPFPLRLRHLGKH